MIVSNARAAEAVTSSGRRSGRRAGTHGHAPGPCRTPGGRRPSPEPPDQPSPHYRPMSERQDAHVR